MDKVVEWVGGGSVINGANPVKFLYKWPSQLNRTSILIRGGSVINRGLPLNLFSGIHVVTTRLDGFPAFSVTRLSLSQVA